MYIKLHWCSMRKYIICLLIVTHICAFPLNREQYGGRIMIQQQINNTCTLPLSIKCPPGPLCPNASVIIMGPGTTYLSCDSALNISASSIVVQGGNLAGLVNLLANNVYISNLVVVGNLYIVYGNTVEVSQSVNVTNITLILPQRQTSSRFSSPFSDSYDGYAFTPNISNNTLVTIQNANITTRKLIIQSAFITIANFTRITTVPNTCLYSVLNVVQFMKIKENGTEALIKEILQQPINILFFTYNDFLLSNSYIRTSIIAIYSNFTNVTHSEVDTTASSCLTNLGQGKGLQAQMPNRRYCSSGGSSAGYGTLSNQNCNSVLQYFMFLTHSFPYLSKGPFLSTGSGGFGYAEDLGHQGAGGGIIFLYSTTDFYSFKSNFLAAGGYVDGNYYVSAGSGGTIFLYTQILSGNYSVFSAAGGASYNNNGSGAGGIVKISYQVGKFSLLNNSMWVNVSEGYQPIMPPPNMQVQSNGIFYGLFCPPGRFDWYLGCHPCANGTFSLLGDSSCQTCPSIAGYSLNTNTSLTGIYNLTQCFSQRDSNFVQIWIEPGRVSWFFIILYVGTLVLTTIIGLLIKKKYRKKLTVMQTQFFSLEDAKKDVQQTRILTQSLKAQRNIKFEDLMYHIHRITLFGSNNPQCPWALPQFPPEQIKPYILRQGFIDFSVKFNKVAKWTKFEKAITSLAKFVYPFYWFYYDKIKKSKYKKLLALLQQSKEFNLINNYDFEDKNMVTIKISKNTDYTICYLDFMVYDRADTKYFKLSSPFIISISGQGNFLRPFYLQDRDVFFNSLFYIINKANRKAEQQDDAKKELFTSLICQKQKQENRNKLIDFLKKFNTISITLDLSAPLSKFIKTLISLIDFIASWNQNYFKQLNIQLDLILMISKVKKRTVLSNQIHILTNKYPDLFEEFMQNNIPKMNRHQKYDLKLGLFVYNPDQQIKKIKNKKSNLPKYKKSWVQTQIGAPLEDQDFQEPLVEHEVEQQQKKGKKKKRIKQFFQNCVRVMSLIRYLLMTHRKLSFDKDIIKFILTVIILFQCLLVYLWSIKLQFPYVLANLISPFIGFLWMVSGSYGIGKLFLIFNAMALLDQIVTLIVYLILDSAYNSSSSKIASLLICQFITITFRLAAVPIATKFLSVSRKLSTSKMFK